MRSWNDALTIYGKSQRVRIIQIGGFRIFSNWRVSSILARQGQRRGLHSPENGFVGIAGNKYWSSTTASSATEKAWVIDFSDNGRDIVNKSLLYLTLPVRGTTDASPAKLWQTGQIAMLRNGKYRFMCRYLAGGEIQGVCMAISTLF